MRYGDVELRNYPEQEKEKRRKEDGSIEFTSNKRATVCVSSQVRIRHSRMHGDPSLSVACCSLLCGRLELRPIHTG